MSEPVKRTVLAGHSDMSVRAIYHGLCGLAEVLRYVREHHMIDESKSGDSRRSSAKIRHAQGTKSTPPKG